MGLELQSVVARNATKPARAGPLRVGRFATAAGACGAAACAQGHLAIETQQDRFYCSSTCSAESQ